jgi:hypothetical protein
MQTAYKPAQELNPTQNLMFQTGHSVVVWSPEMLNLSHKFVGVQFVLPREMVVLHDQSMLEPDQSEAFFAGQLGETRGMVRQTKTAYACALEINVGYGVRGAVILESMTDTPEAAITMFENKLRALGWFDNPRLDALSGILNKVEVSDEREAQAITTLHTAINSAITYRAAMASDMLGEAQRAREGKAGRASLTATERNYLLEIGMELPESVTAPIPTSLDEREIEARFEQNNTALIEVLTAAMNQNSAMMLKMLEAKDKQNDTKETTIEDTGKAADTGKEVASQEGGTTKSTRRSPLASA